MTDSKFQSGTGKDVAAAAEKLRQARLADEARRGKENAIAAGRDEGGGKSPGEGDPVEKKAPAQPKPGVNDPQPAPGKTPPTKHAR